MRPSSHLVALALGAVGCMASAACPGGTSLVEVQPITEIELQPVFISGYFPSNTVIVIGPGETVTVGDAPTDLDTTVTVTEKSTTSEVTTLPPGVTLTSLSFTVTLPTKTSSKVTSSSKASSSSTATSSSKASSSSTATSSSKASSSSTATSSSKTASTTTATSSSKTSSTSSASSTSTACKPPSSLPSACASSIPSACTPVVSATGLVDATVIADCKKALGIYASVPQINACLLPGILSATQFGSCLTAAVPDLCISVLPGACLALNAQTSILSADLDLCIAALLPFSSTSVLNCLGQSTGPGIVSCLISDLGLAVSSTQLNVCVSTAPKITKKACLSVPEICLDLKGDSLVEVVTTDLVHCTDALISAGLHTLTGVLTCLTDILSVSGFLTCLTTTLTGTCIKALPTACSGLTGNAAVTPTELTACATALGSYLTVPAQYCLANGVYTKGTDVVNCLETALFTSVALL